jgi:Right handed beta helix region
VKASKTRGRYCKKDAHLVTRTFLSLALLAIAAPLAAQSERPPFMVEESGKSFWRLGDAVKSIGDGQGTITISPGLIDDCAVQTEGAITYRAAQPGSVVFDGVTCEGKAALVFRGRAARVQGIVFQNMKVPDRNGAGIRLEKGDLDVENAIFRNSEQGILTGVEKMSNITIDRSTFSGLGGCPDGMCSHSAYIGEIASLRVTRSRFERGTGGHYLKARAARVDIRDNSFDDTRGKETNYMIDLPAGSIGAITNNVFVQGSSKENYSAFIAVGAEQRVNPSAGLVISNNDARFAPGVDRSSTFVADWTHEPLKISANRLGAGLKLSDRR